MSQANVEIVRRVYEADARRDSTTVLSLYDPEVVWDTTRTSKGIMGGQLYRGHEGMRRFFREWLIAFESTENVPEEFIDAGDQVVSVVIQRVRGRASGAVVERPLASVWRIRAGRIVEVTWYPNRGEALEAVGLWE